MADRRSQSKTYIGNQSTVTTCHPQKARPVNRGSLEPDCVTTTRRVTRSYIDSVQCQDDEDRKHMAKPANPVSSRYVVHNDPDDVGVTTRQPERAEVRTAQEQGASGSNTSDILHVNSTLTSLTITGVTDETDVNGNTLLHWATKHPRFGDVDAIDKLVLERRSLLNEVNDRLLTPLHLAVIVDRPEVVSCLVRHGAALDVQEKLYGDSVLHLACRLPNGGRCLHAILDTLTQSSGSLNDKKLYLKQLMHSQNFDGETCLHLAARLEDKSSFYSILYSFEFNVNITETKRDQTVLHIAADRGDIEVVSAMIDFGASLNVNQRTSDGLTALDMAVSRRHVEIQRILIDAGGLETQQDDMEWQ